MSWSFSAIGRPEFVKAALQKAVNNYAPSAGQNPSQSYVEFSDAKPHLEGLLDQVFDARDGQPPVIVQIDASGSGSAAPDKQLERSISVSLKKLHGVLV